ncbi:terminase small subunit [Bradyrhizobium sp. AZCC 1708]|uniref:terminase small subunit n=1 Tax=Bradyrhizobium sp. AZCC 1708 TaxID=3117015 RepID=UPI002FEF5328
MPALTPKQQRFVENYLLDLNATQAAIRAGYSARTANQQGPRLLENEDVRKAIDTAKIKRSAETETDAAWVLRRLVAEAEADLADLYTEAGDLKPIEDWPTIWRQGLVAGVEVEALFAGAGEDRRQVGHVKKIRLSDRLRRLELIGKHIRVNAFQEQIAVSGVEALAERIDRAKAKALANVQAAPALPAPLALPPATVARAPIAPPAEQPAPAAPSAPPSPPPPPPQKPAYKPIMPPAPEPAPWPSFPATARHDYDPLND